MNIVENLIKIKMENKIDIKKIVGGGNMAKLTRVSAGVLYYEVKNEDGTYVFPVKGFQSESGAFFKLNTKTQTSPEITINYTAFDKPVYVMTEDVGSTDFVVDVKAIELMRWIRKAIDNGELCKIG